MILTKSANIDPGTRSRSTWTQGGRSEVVGQAYPDLMEAGLGKAVDYLQKALGQGTT
jgi:hypothetical protein